MCHSPSQLSAEDDDGHSTPQQQRSRATTFCSDNGDSSSRLAVSRLRSERPSPRRSSTFSTLSSAERLAAVSSSGGNDTTTFSAASAGNLFEITEDYTASSRMPRSSTLGCLTSCPQFALEQPFNVSRSYSELGPKVSARRRTAVKVTRPTAKIITDLQYLKMRLPKSIPQTHLPSANDDLGPSGSVESFLLKNAGNLEVSALHLAKYQRRASIVVSLQSLCEFLDPSNWLMLAA